MLAALTSGFMLSFSLILAIGAQNAFVFRQGLTARHVHLVVWFCALSDALLICAGVFGVGSLIAPIMDDYHSFIFLLAALWLGFYGVLRLRSAYLNIEALDGDTDRKNPKEAIQILTALFLITWLNPHVYIDTVLLIGTLSIGFDGYSKTAFAIGACCASLSFFSLLGYGAAKLSRYMVHPRSWQIVDYITAAIMFSFAGIMLWQTGWFNS